ncbi:MAG: hypothetical protein EXR73_05780 [Myxococcales bacterium]|nr:hypothetical protein [Myxococcales bacterium]
MTAVHTQTLGLVLSTGAPADLAWTVALARAARRRRIDVSLFLMDRGALWTAAGAAEGTSATVRTLLDDGCDVVVCATSLASAAAPGVVVGGQDDHARLAERSDRVVAFT